MGLNVPWRAIFRLVRNPRLIVPDLTVDSVGSLDFAALARSGYSGIVFDKDNCLTVPLKDTLVPELEDGWKACKAAFGPQNVLIVSNSAGTHEDPGYLEAESLQRNLGVPVLIHSTKKPNARCIKEIYAYFDSLSAVKLEPSSSSLRNTHTGGIDSRKRRLVVCGDRLLTDVLLANQMGPEKLAVWTQRLWKRRDVTVLRTLEKLILRLVIAFKGEDPHKHKEDTAQYVRGSLVTVDPLPDRLTKCITTLRSIWQRLSRN